MQVFVTGASGWIGSAVIPDLISAGHTVTGLARSDASAAVVERLGGQVVRGSLSDLDVLTAAAREADGVVHLAFHHDFSDLETAIRLDAEASEAIGAALAGTGKPFAAASGTPGMPGAVATEEDEPALDNPLSARFVIARAVAGLAEQGVRSSVVRLPRSVHGTGDHGFIPALIGIARQHGVSGYVGDGSSRWPAVHVHDAARLFRLALEAAPAGSVLHAVGDEGVAVREIAEVIGRHLDLPVREAPAEQFGFLGGLLGVDQPASSARTQQLLDWHPSGPGLLDDLEKGHYFS